MSPSTQVAIRMPDDLLAWLRARAAAEHRTLAGVVKALLEEARLVSGGLHGLPGDRHPE